MATPSNHNNDNPMTFGNKQALLGVCFLGLLAGPLAFRERLTTNAATNTDQNTAIDRYEYDSAGAILIIIIAIVMFAEYSSGYVRKCVQ